MTFFGKKILFFALLSFFFIPLLGKADMTGGNFHIYADNFSILDDNYSVGGNYGLFSSGGEFSAGIIQNPAVGSISFTSVFDFGFGDYFILDNGTNSTTFRISNAGGNFNGVCVTETGAPVIPVEWTDCDFGYLIDNGGGASIATLTNRFVTAINSSSVGFAATNDAPGLVGITNMVAEGAAGNRPIFDHVTNNSVVFTGMNVSGGGFSLRGGFQAMELGAVSLNLNTTSISLGTLSLDAVSSASVIATVSSDGGYVLSATEDGNLRSGANDIDDTVGNVVAATEAYGIRTNGVDGQQNGVDVALSGADTTIGLNVGSVMNQPTTVTFKAAIDTDTLSGAYAHTVTFSLTSSL